MIDFLRYKWNYSNRTCGPWTHEHMRKFTETQKYTCGPCFKLGSPPFDKIASEQDPHIIHKGKDLFEDGEQELTEEYEEKQLNININDFIDVRDEDAGTVKSLINQVGL